MRGRRGRHVRRRALARWPIAVGAAVIAFGAAAATLGVAAPPRPEPKPGRTAAAVTPLIIPNAHEPARWPRWGLTHTQHTPGDEPEMYGSAAATLGAQGLVQNQHIMGFGANNPEPRPGEYDFSSLDARVKMMSQTGGAPVITLCCAPDWMKGGKEGDTDWTLLEIAPRQEHFDDFARLAAAVARRYPNVRRFIVWNEFKGLWDRKRGEWNAIAYTDLYNRVYDALKAVNPAIQVGGPYVPVNSFTEEGYVSDVSGPWGAVDGRALKAVDYWLRHKKGADFIVVDGGSTPNDGPMRPDAFGAVGKFGAMTRWLRERSNLPVWWAEFYPLPCASVDPGGSCEALSWPERRRTAVTAVALMELAESGADTVLYWDTYVPRTMRDTCPLCLVSNLDGRATPTLTLIQDFARWFPAGTEPVPVEVSSPGVRVLGQQHRVVAVNTTATTQAVTVDGGDVVLEPYEVRWLPRAEAGAGVTDPA